MRATTSSSPNPRRKVLTPEQAEVKKEKAVRFLRDVVGDNLISGTDSTGEELADEIERESLEEYAERKGLPMENPLRTDREIIEHVLATYLPSDASREERRRAISAAQQGLQELPPDASDVDVLEAVTEAVQPVADQVKSRCRIERVYSLRYLYLPADHTDQDLAEWQRMIAGVVQALPVSASDSQVDQQVREATEALMRTRQHRHSLTDYGKNCVCGYLNELWREGLIDRRERFDSRLKAELEQAVSEGLQEELTGDEEPVEIEEIVRSVIDNELGIEYEDEEED